jgi:hypothetical protein
VANCADPPPDPLASRGGGRRKGGEEPRGAEALLWLPAAARSNAGEGARGGRPAEWDWLLLECMVTCMVVVVWRGGPPTKLPPREDAGRGLEVPEGCLPGLAARMMTWEGVESRGEDRDRKN